MHHHTLAVTSCGCDLPNTGAVVYQGLEDECMYNSRKASGIHHRRVGKGAFRSD